MFAARWKHLRLRRAAWLAALVLLDTQAVAYAADSGIAVVFSLAGTAQLIVPSGGKKDLKLFDWLPSGAVIEVGRSSKVAVAYANGNRYALAESTKATIVPDGPQALSGKVSSLESVPALPHLAALANAGGTRAAASRIRGGLEGIKYLYPFMGCAALPEDAILRFAAVDGAARYRVELEDESGRTVLDAETQLPSLKVPVGILQPGARYYWMVTTVERMGPALRADNEFSTLPEEDIRRRARLRVALVKNGDFDSLALLAEIDRRLGLLMEAREEFKEALTKSSGDAALQRALLEIERQLSSDSENR